MNAKALRLITNHHKVLKSPSITKSGDDKKREMEDIYDLNGRLRRIVRTIQNSNKNLSIPRLRTISIIAGCSSGIEPIPWLSFATSWKARS